MPLRISRLWLCGVVVAMPVNLRAEEAAQLKAYSVGLLDLETAATVIRGLLSPQGALVEDRAHHRLLVHDRPEVHARISAALRQLQVPSRNVRITVTHSAERTDDARGIEAAGRGRIGDVTVGAGRRPPRRGVDIRGEASSRQASSRSQQQILVMSGGKASLQVAESVPYVEWLQTWGGPYGLAWSQGVQWQDVGSSLVVEPLDLGDGRLRLRLTPAFSRFVDRDRQTTEIHQLATEVVVREGEEVDLGGVPFRDEQFRERFFLGFGEGGTVQRVTIRVRADVE